MACFYVLAWPPSPADHSKMNFISRFGSPERLGSLKISFAMSVVFAVMLTAVACSGTGSDGPVSRNEGPIILSDGSVATASPQPIADQPAAVPDGLEIVWETYSILVREYVVREKIDPDVLARIKSWNETTAALLTAS